MNTYFRFFEKAVFGALLILLLIAGNLLAQTQYKIHICDIEKKVHKNWMWIPDKVDYTVRWEILRLEQDEFVRESFTKIPTYQVFYSRADSTFREAKVDSIKGQNSMVFLDMDVGEKYYFRVEGVMNENIVQSDTAWIVTGRQSQATMQTQVENGKNLEIPLEPPWPFNQLFGIYSEVYIESSFFGKVAFELIKWFFILGIYITFYRCLKFIRLGNVFPLMSFNISSLKEFGFDRQWEKRISPKYRFIIEAWKQVMKKDTNIARTTNNLEAAAKMAYENWKRYGVSSIETLESIIGYKPEKDDNGEVKKQLSNEIESAFSILKGKNLVTNSEYGKQETKWKEVENFLFDDKNADRFEYHPSVKILSAGLANHKANGYRWLEASDEVDRAIENRAASEIEILKGKSWLDWLWNLGATAPLLGLFGTVTGIQVAFKKLSELKEDTPQQELINMLADGIFTALWTTILGLIAGIILIMLYYYYRNKLSWIYSKWEQIYVHITEKL
ncbi:MotA/TolQ/ExbB proton channel family protein [candidate division KSB1 bacterium]|nr:MotA/TolQ/ExbB proton channel family protein [candidate division KSB1 bacterium]MBL7094742.1 MotA/TolQ/ExbB proton channel family protein [candidate division KSB1 bacterium]